MIALASAMDAEALIWQADGGERRLPVSELVTGPQQNLLELGDVIRSIDFPRDSLQSRTAFRRIALSPLGRTGTLVIGRLARDGSFTVTVTGGTSRPEVLRFDELPTATDLEVSIDAIATWYDDPHGSPDWRHKLSGKFAQEVRAELAAAA